MAVVYHEIYLPIDTESTFDYIVIKQGDAGTHKVRATLISNNRVYTIPTSGASYFMKFRKPDNNYCLVEATVSDNTISAEVTEEMLRVSGTGRGEFMIVSGSDELKTATFHVKIVRQTFTSGDVQSHSDFAPFAALLQGAGAAASNANTAAAAANAAASLAEQKAQAIPDDYSDLVAEVEEVKADLGALDSLSIYTIDESLWTQSGISPVYGTLLDNGKRITQTDALSLDGQDTKFFTDSGYSFMVYKYSKDGAYIGALQTSGTFEKSNANIKMCTEYTINAVDTASYNYRLMLRKDNNDTITVSDSSHLSAMLLNLASYVKQNTIEMADNPFKYASYRFGGYGQGISLQTSTGVYIDANTLTTRAGSNIPVAVNGGRLVAKRGYKVVGRYLTSLKMEEITAQGVAKDVYVDRIIYSNRKNTVNIIPRNAKYVALTISKDDTTQDFTQNEIDNLYGTAFVYYSDKEIETLTSGGFVRIDALKTIHPEYTDDQLLDEAVLIARACGGGTKILWDGSDISFSGQTHYCYGFGGIDFNDSQLIMPDVDGTRILEILPEASSMITAAYSDITKFETTDANLKGKVFAMNSNYSGNADMCLGSRIGFDNVIYYTPTVKTSPDGFFESGELYLVPLSGSVECQNVHDYPDTTFEIGNATISASQTNNMTGFMYCTRSNVRLHDIVLSGQSTMVSGSTKSVAVFRYCMDIEVDHISGINPTKKDLSGYVLGLYMVSSVYVHDCFVGDSTAWGSIGGSHLSNSVFERCYFNRWDSHYAQYGHNTIRDSYFNFVAYGGAGYGTFTLENCTITAIASDSLSPLIAMRSDLVGVYDGNIIIKNCIFQKGGKDADKIIIVGDGNIHTKPSNSKITGSPAKRRIIKNCVFPSGCHAIFKIGLSAQADRALYQNLTYEIKDSDILCTEGVFVPYVSGQSVKEVVIDGCSVGECTTTKGLSANVKVSNSDIVAVVTDGTIPKLTATGNVFSGEQSVSNFTAYALAGNIASDMASVNKHS